jgi:3-oxoacyl-[acyl-carrier protein] reductase
MENKSNRTAEFPPDGYEQETVPQLAPDLIRLGITIHAVDPGPTDTGWMTEELKAQIRNESKRGVVNSPDDAARLIVSILTQANRSTGEVIHATR